MPNLTSNNRAHIKQTRFYIRTRWLKLWYLIHSSINCLKLNTCPMIQQPTQPIINSNLHRSNSNQATINKPNQPIILSNTVPRSPLSKDLLKLMPKLKITNNNSRILSKFKMIYNLNRQILLCPVSKSNNKPIPCKVNWQLNKIANKLPSSTSSLEASCSSANHRRPNTQFNHNCPRPMLAAI